MAFTFNGELLKVGDPIRIRYSDTHTRVITGNVAGIFETSINVVYKSAGRLIPLIVQAEDVGNNAVFLQWAKSDGTEQNSNDNDVVVDDGGSGSGALSVPDDAFFADETERDAFFDANTDRLVEGAYCVTDGVLQKYINGGWVDMTAVIRGPEGKPGKDGITPEIGANGNWWIDTSDTGVQTQGAEGETPQFRMNGNMLQYRFQTKAPAVWTDLFELPDKSSYTHTQNIAASVWTIPHNLGQQFVGVRVNNFTGDILIPDIEYTSANVVTLTFFMPVSGTAQIYK